MTPPPVKLSAAKSRTPLKRSAKPLSNSQLARLRADLRRLNRRNPVLLAFILVLVRYALER